MNYFDKISLRMKIILMVMLVIIGLGASSLYSMRLMSRAFMNEIMTSYGDVANNLGLAISAQFFERYGDVQAFALNDTIQSMNGKIMQSDLDSYVSLYGLYDLILVVDKNGNFVASNTKDISGKNINQQELAQLKYDQAPWFKAAISGQFTEDKENNFSGTFFEDLHVDPLLKVASDETRVTTGFTTTIKDSKGNVIGVITNRANSKWIDSELQFAHNQMEAAGDLSVQMTIVDKDGFNLSEIRPAEHGGKKEVVYDLENIFRKQNLKEVHVPAGAKLVEGGSGAVISLDKVDNGEDVVGYSHIKNPKWISSIGWGVMVHNDVNEVMTAELKAEYTFYTIFGLTTILAIAFAIFFGLSTSKRISSLIQDLTSNSNELSAASTRVASSSTQLSEASTEQAAALQETVAAVDEISAMVDKNAESANRSKESSASSREAALKGKQNVDNMINAISQISEGNEEVARQMQSNNDQLSEITKMIADIETKTKVINEIVFQTKLLSFNASVEAARAGEYGKGFAVVAEEVGNLAQMSGNAAKEITTLLENSIRQVESIVSSSKSKVEKLMNDSREKVKAGTETAHSCNESLEEILTQVSSVDTLVSEIAMASQEQATGIKEIAKAVGQMEEVVQQNSSVAEASSQSAAQLNSQSKELNAIVQRLMVLSDGKVSNASPASPRKPDKSEEKKAKILNFKAVKQQVPKPAPAAEPVVEKKVASGESMPSANDPGFEE